jgi:hypothetical protein
MKLKPEFFLIFLVCSWICKPASKRKEVSIHNQTDRAIIVLDSLNVGSFKLYDTAIINGRRYISRKPNYISEYGVYTRFYSLTEIDYLKNKNMNKITLYVIDCNDLLNVKESIVINHSYRSLDISIATLEKYELNHLFITADTMLIEHDYDYSSVRR